ncbi:hypothetical protein F444_22953 [Phytophthora nicotianae P1976]|uniref:Uncharacterized protein n=1 Tax=Phytophthora nicotianae P1976 TaxID=1317066 RepID=A0A080YWA6_PHYNI|nr:hypothetical protein F444_22953 [Phytophthora nicotianae P1976]
MATPGRDFGSAPAPPTSAAEFFLMVPAPKAAWAPCGVFLTPYRKPASLIPVSLMLHVKAMMRAKRNGFYQLV